MLKTTVIVLTGLLGALVMAGVLAVAAFGVRIGDGAPVTERRAVDAPFDRIDARGAGDVDVELRAGARPSVTVHAGTKTIDDVGTRVEAGTLILEADDGDGPFLEIDVADPRIVVIAPSVRETALHGSGDLTVDGVDAHAFTAMLDGSGDLVARGRATELTATLDGSGDLAVDGVDAKRVRVSLDGSGDLAYAGDAEVVERQVDGSGDIEAR